MIKRLASKLFKWYCHPEFYDDIQGDLEELYTAHLEAGSFLRDWRYAVDVLLLFRPSLMRPFFKNSIIYTGMFKNYFKISIRNLANNKAYTAINVFGLAIGLASFLLINEYIRFERSYDRFFSQADQIYRLTTDQVKEGSIGVRDAMSFYPSGSALQQELPAVLDYTATYKFNEVVFRNNDRVIFEKNIVGADSNYFRLFDYTLVQEKIRPRL